MFSFPTKIINQNIEFIVTIFIIKNIAIVYWSENNQFEQIYFQSNVNLWYLYNKK